MSEPATDLPQGSLDLLIVEHSGAGARLAMALGTLGALYPARFVSALLYGIEARNPVAFAIVPVLLIAVTLGASWVPAARATRVDPIETLRHQ